MKNFTLIFTALAFVLGVAVISCTKESTQTDPAITTATDAVLIDNSAAEISGIVDDYQASNPTAFVDPTLKAGVADVPASTKGIGLDNCATVTIAKTPVLTGTVVTGATIVFTIDYGTAGCVNKDGKTRRGKIVSTYTWVKEGGWSRVSTTDLYVSDIHYVGYLSTKFGVTGTNNHAYNTEASALVVTAKDSTKKAWSSNRQRELMEGNGGVNPVKIWKITGSSTFTNVKNEKSTYTITSPLYTASNCKGFVAGTVETVSTAGVKTTIDYGTYTTPSAVTCKDGYTVKLPGDAAGKGAITTFIKFSK